MRVISVDPGYDRIGIAVLELVDGQEKVLFSDCVETDKALGLNERIDQMASRFKATIEKYSPDVLGIETLFFNKNQKTALGVAQARGVLIYIARSLECQVYEFGPQEIKIAVTGYGKSDKSSVIDMVKRLVLNVPKEALDDEYDAIAVGVTCLAHHGRKTP